MALPWISYRINFSLFPFIWQIVQYQPYILILKKEKNRNLMQYFLNTFYFKGIKTWILSPISDFLDTSFIVCKQTKVLNIQKNILQTGFFDGKVWEKIECGVYIGFIAIWKMFPCKFNHVCILEGTKQVDD